MPIVRARPDFVGRRAELAALERQYASRRAVLVPVYGWRRVGKTELLLRFAAGKPAVFFTASDKLRLPQIADLLRAAAECLGAPALAEANPTTWDAALRLVVGAAPGERLLLILDEFQWLCASSPELPSVLQRLWDLEWQRSSKLMLVLCGSFIGFMEREVLGVRSPLHGRRTGDLRLEPFGYREAAGFHPRWSREEQARAYFVCGGIPAYLGRFEQERSVAQNIAQGFQGTRFKYVDPGLATDGIKQLVLGRRGTRWTLTLDARGPAVAGLAAWADRSRLTARVAFSGDDWENTATCIVAGSGRFKCK